MNIEEIWLLNKPAETEYVCGSLYILEECFHLNYILKQ